MQRRLFFRIFLLLLCPKPVKYRRSHTDFRSRMETRNPKQAVFQVLAAPRKMSPTPLLRSITKRLALHCLVLYTLLSCRSPLMVSEQEPSASLPNIVLITMDTTRQDRIGSYGYSSAKTNAIDQFAKEGYRLTHAYSTVPLTTPAHASMLTGLYPPHHGIRGNGDAILVDAVKTLPEVLQENGYQTVAAVSAFVTTSIWNLDQGFDRYFDDMGAEKSGRWSQERPAKMVVDDLLGWRKSKGPKTPFFMWAHFYDPHLPHIVHPGYEAFDDPYDAEIAYMDDQIERLYTEIEADHPNTIWVLLADHGEAFQGEHSERSHGLFLYDETMKIPWIIRPYPRLESTKTISTPTSIVDLPNTVLGLIGLDPMTNIDGVDILQTNHSDPIYMESSVVEQRFGYHPEIALTDGQSKLMATPTPHLYDLSADPSEIHNIYQDKALWQRWISYGHQVFQEPSYFSLEAPDASVMKKLAILGYIGDIKPQKDLKNYNIDAKDRLSTIQRLEALVSLRTEAIIPQEAITALRNIIIEEPQLIEARLLLGQILRTVGQQEEALSTLEEAYKIRPDSIVLSLNLANHYADMGQYNRGIALLEEVLLRIPQDSGAQSNIIRMLSDAGNHKEAIARGTEWLSHRPSETLQAILGVILVRDLQWTRAKEQLELSLADGIPREHVHRSLGHIALVEKKNSIAHKEYERELEYFPDPQLQRTLAQLYAKDKKWDKAAQHFCAIRSDNPQDIQIHLDCAQSWFNQKHYSKARAALLRAKKLKPNAPYVLLLEANLEEKTGDKTKALELFTQAQQALKAEKEQRNPQ